MNKKRSFRSDVAVVGGGITGLVAALTLADAGIDVEVFEADERPGGKIATASLNGVRIEEGPDALLPRDAQPLRLLERLGLGGDLVSPAVFGGLVAHRGRLHPVPQPTLMGFPLSLGAIARAGVLSVRGKARAAAGLLRRTALSGPDVSVGHYARSRFGDEVAELLVAPLLAGTRAGDLDDISLAAALPEVDALARRRPVLRAPAELAGRAFVAPRAGMSVLAEALAEALGPRLHTGALIASLGDLDARAVLLALPATDAARLVNDEDTAELLQAIPHASGATVNLLFPAGAVRAPAYGSGLLVAPHEAGSLAACTWVDRKWPHLAPPDGSSLVRCFAGHRADLERPDEYLTGALVADLARLVPVTAEPVAVHVRRWHGALPVYRTGHLRLVEAVERSLAPRSILVAGADFRGTGIPDCIAQGRAAAARMQAMLN